MMRFLNFTLLLILCALALKTEVSHAQNPPHAPMITEPATDGQIVNPADVHMETAPSFAHLAQGAPVPWRVAPPGYQVEIVAKGLQLPETRALKAVFISISSSQLPTKVGRCIVPSASSYS